VLALALLAAACSSGDEEDGAGSTTTTDGASASGVAWERDDLQPVAEPLVVGDALVVLVAEEGSMQVVGLDPVTGETTWSAEASPGYAPPGIAVGITDVGDDAVAFLRPAGEGLMAELVVADATTGEERWSSSALGIHSQPGPCEDGADVCALADLGVGLQLVRFLGEGALRPEPFPTGARVLGDGLLDLGGREPELLAGYEGGEVRWQTPLADVFGPGLSSDYGWMFAAYDDVVVGSVGQDVPLDLPIVVDVERDVTAGLGRGDGRPRWREVGTSFTCTSKLALQMGDGGAHEDAEDWQPWPVRCRAVGTTTYESLEGEGRPELTSLVVEGFDPATGETTWSVEVDPALLTEDLEALPTLAGEHAVVVPGLDGPVVLDLEDGATRPLGDDDLLWCRAEAEFEIDEAWSSSDGIEITERRGGVLARPCRADGGTGGGEPTSFPPSIAVPAGDVRVVSTPGGVVAYRPVTG
jgi:hypothetical protein